MYMRLKYGKSKVFTLSYDDGVVQDIRLMEIFNKYGLKATFNINTGCFLPEDSERERLYGRLRLSEAQKLYTDSGHEIAVHGYTHSYLEKSKYDEVINEILLDRKSIEKQFKTVARGMAYPFGTYNERVISLLKDMGICYARTVNATKNFFFPQNWLELNPTCHHNDSDLMNLAERFVNEQPTHQNNWMFYLWGHSYEFDNDNNWELITNFVEYISFKDDVWYATNIEIYDYVMAYERLVTSVDKKIVYNPSVIDVWFSENNETYCIKGGETLFL